MKTKLPILLLLCLAIASFAQAPDRQQFIRIEAPVIALMHVRVIDGTAAAPRDDQTIVISGGKFASVSRARRHNNSHYRQRPSIYGPGDQGLDRFQSHGWAQDA